MATRRPAPRPGQPGQGPGSNGGGEDGVNIQVVVRCRPLSREEIASRAPCVVKCTDALREVTLQQNIGGKQIGRTYHFDRVLSGETTQEELYQRTVSPMVDEMLEGFNCTIFAYGQTGTGKTYTMNGEFGDELGGGAPGPHSGVVPRAIYQVFAYLDALGNGAEFTVKASYLELYNEEITDLLVCGPGPSSGSGIAASAPPSSGAPPGAPESRIRILEDRSGVVLAGLEEAHVTSAAEVYALLERGGARRRTAETLLNRQSSRSHSVFVLTVSVRETLAEGEEVIRVGKLYLVDLAGSENVSRSGAVEGRAKEAGNINRSLLTLGRVITALVEGQGHVPYRDSKLTRLLRDSLGGRTKTCIVATVAPTVGCADETLSTLEYAHRAKSIKNRPEVNQRIAKTTHLREMNVEIERLKGALLAAREKNGVFLPPQQYEAECALRDELQRRVTELEEDRAKEAERVRERLELAEKEVEQHRADLCLARAFVAELARAERRLAAHARAAGQGLRLAARDLAALFAHADRCAKSWAANDEAVEGLEAGAAGKLPALEENLRAWARADDARRSDLREALAALASSAADPAPAARDAAVEERLAEATRVGASAWEGLGAAGREGLEALAEGVCAELQARGRAQAEAASAAAEAAAEAGAALQAAAEEAGRLREAGLSGGAAVCAASARAAEAEAGLRAALAARARERASAQAAREEALKERLAEARGELEASVARECGRALDAARGALEEAGRALAERVRDALDEAGREGARRGAELEAACRAGEAALEEGAGGVAREVGAWAGACDAHARALEERQAGLEAAQARQATADERVRAGVRGLGDAAEALRDGAGRAAGEGRAARLEALEALARSLRAESEAAGREAAQAAAQAARARRTEEAEAGELARRGLEAEAELAAAASALREAQAAGLGAAGGAVEAFCAREYRGRETAAGLPPRGELALFEDGDVRALRAADEAEVARALASGESLPSPAKLYEGGFWRAERDERAEGLAVAGEPEAEALVARGISRPGASQEMEVDRADFEPEAEQPLLADECLDDEAATDIFTDPSVVSPPASPPARAPRTASRIGRPRRDPGADENEAPPAEPGTKLPAPSRAGKRRQAEAPPAQKLLSPPKVRATAQRASRARTARAGADE